MHIKAAAANVDNWKITDIDTIQECYDQVYIKMLVWKNVGPEIVISPFHINIRRTSRSKRTGGLKGAGGVSLKL